MAAALNKRQQARNERTLQELIKTVPGNSTCADCGARNPGWASWSLGIFLCMRCAALHRKLGTHISKVKSLSMDKWDNSHVDNMKRIGNVESNKAYNPRNVKPQIPIDIDEVDSAMERYIRQKYQERIFLTDSRPGTRHNTGSTSSAEDRPPPLPPKPTKRFGFGLQKSATAPRNVTPPISPGLHGFPETSPPRVSKPSRVFGSDVSGSGDGLESKLATLRDMGFPDEKRNLTVLKGLNGNLDRSVEALIRLGEQNPGKSRGNTPTPPAKPDHNGLSFERSNTAPAAANSMNPFDALDMVAPVQQQQQQQQQQPQPVQTQQVSYATNGSQATSPSNPYNPFMGQQAQQAYPQYQQQQQQQQPQPQQAFAQGQNPFGQPQQGLEQSFQNMQLSNTQQPQQLFPNRTGGHAQPPNPSFAQSNPFQQSFTPPPMPQMPPQYQSFIQPQQSNYQSPISPSAASNPFLKSSRSQMFTPTYTSSNPFDMPQQQAQQQPQQQLQQQQQQQSPNPFLQQSQVPTSQAPANQWQNQMSNPHVQSQNPWQSQQAAYQPQNQGNYPQQFQQQQQPNYMQQPQGQGFPQQQGGFNKSSIMALYNYPQLAPQRSESSQPATAAPAPAAAAPGPVATGPTSPPAGSMNPFAAGQAGAPQGQTPGTGLTSPISPNGPRHVSNESVDFAGLMGGRHSPDAFSGLSASFRR